MKCNALSAQASQAFAKEATHQTIVDLCSEMVAPFVQAYIEPKWATVRVPDKDQPVQGMVCG